MRLPLRYQITIALVLFGLIPAGVVAWYALDATIDYKHNEQILIKQAAAMAGNKIEPLLKPAIVIENGKPTGEWDASKLDRNTITTELDAVVSAFEFNYADVFVVDARNQIVISARAKRRARSQVTPILPCRAISRRIPLRPMEPAAPEGGQFRMGPCFRATPATDSSPELVGFRPSAQPPRRGERS